MSNSNGLVWFDKIGGKPVRVSLGDYGRDSREIKKVEKVTNGKSNKVFHVMMQSAQGKNGHFIIYVDKGKSERFLCTEGEIVFPLGAGSETGKRRETGGPAPIHSNGKSKIPSSMDAVKKGNGGALTSCLAVPTDKRVGK